MGTITTYPQYDPETGEAIDNLKTMPQEVIEHLRERGLSGEEIRTLQYEVHDAVEDVRQILRLITMPSGEEH
jgi:hypothetical protein